jgi:hypothetical protein
MFKGKRILNGIKKWTTEHEKRTRERLSVPVLVRAGKDTEGYRTVLDISNGGLRMRSGLSLENGQWLKVRLFFPQLVEEVEVTGKVVWNENMGEFGLDFRCLDNEDAVYLNSRLRVIEDKKAKGSNRLQGIPVV